MKGKRANNKVTIENTKKNLTRYKKIRILASQRFHLRLLTVWKDAQSRFAKFSNKTN